MTEKTIEKLKILADSAKYDVSCSSSGSARKNIKGGVGNALVRGCCHSFTEDGRCISLLKVLMSNACIYDCAYCVNRRSNDIPRASFTVRELVDLTMAFYRRNYIEGLFLSSAVLGGPDRTMCLMIRAAKELRLKERFNGYIHMKCIPGASRELVRQAGLYADRLSVNIEIPSERNLKFLAPEKDYQSVYTPMYHIHKGMLENLDERRRFPHAPDFAPAGQSTQMIVGASNERDRDILRLASLLYKGPKLKRVYYSGFVPVNAHDSRLPAHKPVPLKRENRLYQADWLMRLYHFDVDEIVDETCPDLDLEIDPKIAWALRHPGYFPVDVNRADYRTLLRVPGIGLITARRILHARRYGKLGEDHLKRLGVVLGRAKYFLALGQAGSGRFFTIQEAGPAYVRRVLTAEKKPAMRQLSLFTLAGAADETAGYPGGRPGPVGRAAGAPGSRSEPTLTSAFLPMFAGGGI